MSRKKLSVILFMVLGVASVISAVEVINIDFNGYGDNSVYTGTAAYNDGVNLWHTYYGGWGVPMGSPKSANLISYNAPTQAGTYAEQVWIGDVGNHNYVGGSGLLDDGFKKNPSEPNDPNVAFFGGRGAYGVLFDMYVYADEAGYFKIQDGNNITERYINGIFPPGTFVLDGNYALFENVSIGEPNQILLIYTNKLSAVQLVSKKQPVSVASGTVIDARNYDVAYDTNARGGELTFYGPDIGTYYVHYLDANEYMEYDITVTAANKGLYGIKAGVVTTNGDASFDIYLDGTKMGTLTAPTGSSSVILTNTIYVNLLAGNHTLKWYLPVIKYNEIMDIRFTWLQPITMANCADVYKYKANYAGDVSGDCEVDLDDLALLIADWANCYNPEPGACD